MKKRVMYKKDKRFLFIIIAFFILVFYISLWIFQKDFIRMQPGLSAGFESATYKIRQDYVFPSGRLEWQIKSARNEFEPFQLVLKEDSTLTGVDVEISDFTGPGRIDKGNVTIFWVGYVNVTTRSSYDGELGEWPDILVPKVDSYYHETRNFFPFTLNASRVQPIWFDVFVPNSTLPGNYIAKVNVTQNGMKIFEGNVTLEVWDFSLPATSSMTSQFSLNGDAVWTGFYYPNPPNWEADIANLMRMYIRAGLRHRMTFSPRRISFGSWNSTALDYDYISGTSSKVSDRWFNRTIWGFMGEGNPQVEYGNSTITSLMSGFSSFYMEEINRNYGDCTGAPTTPPSSLVIRARKAAELIYSVLSPRQRAIYYVLPLDEPGGGENGCGSANPGLDYNSSIAIAKEIRAAGLKTYVTKTRRTELLNVSVNPPRNDFWDMWVPYFNNVVGRDWAGVGYNRRAEYDADISNGAKLIWYQSCMTHGCGSFGGHELDGNPQYGLEYPAIFARIFPWATFKYDVQGEGYYAVVLGLNNPWYSQWNRIYYTNGEGNFFYPGLVNAANNGFSATTLYGNSTPSIGGIHDIPIESIRLKMIREGYEDYEYFYKLKQMGNDSYAKEQVSRAVVTTYDFTRDPNLIYSVRENVARAILYMPPNYCGNAIINSGEGCDDGDMENGDGCSSSCAIESGWTCAGQPSVCTRVSGCIDSDNDGYNTTTGGSCGSVADCNDNNRSIYPGAVELCNGVDDNCDGRADIQRNYYRDAEGDTYGTGSVLVACSQPSGYVLNNLDCNDGNALINLLKNCNYNDVSCGVYSLCVSSCPVPPAEICGNGIDEDCNGADLGCIGVKPILSLTNPQNTTYKNKPVPISFTSSGASNCWYVFNNSGVNVPCTSYSSSLNGLGTGYYDFSAVANNSYGETRENRRFEVITTRKYSVKYRTFASPGSTIMTGGVISGISATTNLDDLSDLELQEIELSLDNGSGAIEFLEPVNLTENVNIVTNEIDLDSNVLISENRIEVKSEVMSSLDKRARITFRGLGFNNPRLLRDGAICTSCTIISYFGGELVGEVTGFSVYTAEETPVSPPAGGGGGGGGGGGFPAVKPKAENVTNITKITGQEETIVLGDELIFVDVGEDVEERIIVDAYGNKYLVTFILTNDRRVVAKLFNGDYVVPSDNILSISIDNDEMYVGVVEGGDGGKRVVLGLNENSVRSEVVSAEERAKRNYSRIYYALIGVVAVFVILIIVLTIRHFIRAGKERTENIVVKGKVWRDK